MRLPDAGAGCACSTPAAEPARRPPPCWPSRRRPRSSRSTRSAGMLAEARGQAVAIVGDVRAQPDRRPRRSRRRRARSTASWPPTWCAISPTRTRSCATFRALLRPGGTLGRARILGARLPAGHRGVEHRVRDDHHSERRLRSGDAAPVPVPAAKRERVRRCRGVPGPAARATASPPCIARRCRAGSATSCTHFSARGAAMTDPRRVTHAAPPGLADAAALPRPAARRRRRRRHRRTGRGHRAGRTRRHRRRRRARTLPRRSGRRLDRDRCPTARRWR